MKSNLGFTLIELLIVISVLGVLASGILIVVNPKEKIDLANDAKVQSDISSIASAMNAYLIANGGLFPDGNWPTLLSSGGANGNATTILGGMGGLISRSELTSIPVPPPGYGSSYTYYWDNSVMPPKAKIIGALKSQKSLSLSGGSSSYWAWCSWLNGTSYGPTITSSMMVCP